MTFVTRGQLRAFRGGRGHCNPTLAAARASTAIISALPRLGLDRPGAVAPRGLRIRCQEVAVRRYDRKFIPIPLSSLPDMGRYTAAHRGQASERARGRMNSFKRWSPGLTQLVISASLAFKSPHASYWNKAQKHERWKKEELLHYVEETSLAKDVELENLPVTPCIIVCGPSCYAAVQFMLAVDRNIVNDDITSFISAVCLMFGSYYCSNINYPTELASVLEFLQRCFVIINPEKGNKGGGKENQKATPS
ncbi:hypothetical protein IRJ41_012513 [Triplophysa rosa]|uniref:Uncharacterized protein n=1 Tax=Triplophysa rosa TaxID=992332 RepID=A0A9W7X024_TRIRA|nr:hypothetical protein IRJ41_012513 [Triplophysa rosa]